jgi:nucleotide-binding universal stress UspA family protein
MYKNIIVAIDLNDETSWRRPLVAAAELARKFGAQLHVVTVIREVEAILQAKSSPLAYDMIAEDLDNQLARLIREVDASDLHPHIIVAHGTSIYAEILEAAEEAEAGLIVVGAHRPAMKDYLLGTNASRVMRHARCSVLVARERGSEQTKA